MLNYVSLQIWPGYQNSVTQISTGLFIEKEMDHYAQDAEGTLYISWVTIMKKFYNEVTYGNEISERGKGVFWRLKKDAIPSQHLPKRHFDKSPSKDKEQKRIHREARLSRRALNFEAVNNLKYN